MADRRELVFGFDFGTDSVRALAVDARTGEECAEGEAAYPRWSEGLYCDAKNNQFRQHPQDYIDALREAVGKVLEALSEGAAEDVIGIGIDTTGSTPCAVDRRGRPLALTKEFAENPNAMFVLWKDHTAVEEAEEINEAAKTWGGTDYTQYEGRVYSSEWFWSKILHILREDEKVRRKAYSWVEHCDWMTALLTGTEDPEMMRRSRCAAGHKAMWHAEWGGLPSEEFLKGIDPLLSGLRERLYTETFTSDHPAGNLSNEWADKLGLRAGIPVAIGAFDAHMGAVGGGIRSGTLAKIMGTSTCDMMVADYKDLEDQIIEGICGQVDGSIIPGMIGLEAGQSSFGDVYAWFQELLSWPLARLAERVEDSLRSKTGEVQDELLALISEKAAELDPEDTGLMALDWLNGRRTPYADQKLKGAVAGLTLGTTAPALFRSLVEATIFGAKAIADHFEAHGLAIEEVVALGGIPHKNELVMQLTADIFRMPIKVVASKQACCLGAAMFGAVAAGRYDSVAEAQREMGSGYSEVYEPRPDKSETYDELYTSYRELGEQMEDFLRGM